MKLSQVGVIADICWYEIKNHVKNVDLGEFVVMPNHVHGILILNGDDYGNDFDGVRDVETLHAVETLHETSLPQSQSQYQPPKNEQMAKISPKSNTVSTIIRSYKSAVTKHAHRLEFDFEWQPRFYDHIIRDEKSFHTISQYIINNPLNWAADKFCKDLTSNVPFIKE